LIVDSAHGSPALFLPHGTPAREYALAKPRKNVWGTDSTPR
jgi:hypothetical protein